MKKLVFTAILSSLVLVAAQGYAAEDTQELQDRAAVLQLSGFEARRTMLEYCGVSGDEADKILANDIAAAPQLEASLSDAGKRSLKVELAHARDAVKASWNATPAAQREQACASMVGQMSQ
jgi:hypothetical protein